MEDPAGQLQTLAPAGSQGSKSKAKQPRIVHFGFAVLRGRAISVLLCASGAIYRTPVALQDLLGESKRQRVVPYVVFHQHLSIQAWISAVSC